MHLRLPLLVLAFPLATLLWERPAGAQETTPPAAPNVLPAPESRSPADEAPRGTAPPFVLGGYVEAFYQWNFNVPSNGITNFRGFDNRHNSFTISNVALDAQFDHRGLIGRIALQIGHTPSTYYLAEPGSAGASGANASSAELWKYVQQAYAGYRFGGERGVTLSAGIFLSPIGPESMVVRDNWNWSRSNLFFGLPFYHTGVRASHALTDRWSATIAGYNGWNSVVDNNPEKSVSAQLLYAAPALTFSALYFGGTERTRGTAGGRGWRHLFDAHATWNAKTWLAFLIHGNTGFEVTNFGRAAWAATALSARFHILDPLWFAVRGDVFYERVPENALGAAPAIFWPTPWVSSGTATADFRPHERVSFRLELRHDQAGDPMYFGGDVAGDGNATPFVATRESQDTLTLGATTWF